MAVISSCLRLDHGARKLIAGPRYGNTECNQCSRIRLLLNELSAE
jgi:hypothetical protein